ncbi:lytic transglycosylase domain-containing protein [Desulfonatronovibrio magnus]|uniref:lytic transglycosylase domain-containing protein n=1 Tax=Desulfonatronovibrio magnus TaxID=698827 RepID=UPI0005EB0AC0|nr:lytic transglycosylase domain-containing protein [Desulfonatronovibrio magnus]
MILRTILVVISTFMLMACATTSADKSKKTDDPSVSRATDTDGLSFEADLASRMLDHDNLDLTPERLQELQKESLTKTEEKVLDAEVGFDFFLDAQETQAMENYFKMFTHTHRHTFENWLKRSETFLPYIKGVFQERGLPTDLIYLPFAESGFNAWAYSRAGAAGLWQFMPATGRHYGLRVDWWMDERRNPYLSTHSAADYLEKLFNDFDDWYLALAAYNAGEGRVSRAMVRSGHDNYFDLIQGPYLARETRNYVPKFLAILKIVHNLEELGFEPINWDNAPDLREIEVQPGTDLLALANACNMDWDDFRHLNPAFRRQVSPSNAAVDVMVPAAQYELANNFLQSPDSRPFAGYQRYQVGRGDSWWRISNRFGVPVNVLKAVNNTNSNLLRVGQYVIVPAGGSGAQVASSTTQDHAQRRATYIVQRGDTLSEISSKFNVNLATLMASNGINNPRSLRAGQRLYIPGPTQAAQEQGRQVEYQVRRGDTIWGIARRFGVEPRDLQRWNNISGNQIIRPGDSLRVYVR